MTEDVGATLEEAIAFKKRLVDEPEAEKKWRLRFIEGSLQTTADFLNTPPAQGPGEAFAVSRSGNETMLFYYL